MRKRLALTLGILLFLQSSMLTDAKEQNLETITFGAGCFWCVEAVYQRLDGVVDAVSGYMGGDVANPSYKQVVTGRTGHAEVVQLTFDPSKTDAKTLIDFFWEAHDPTTLNRQGADVGTQYRSAIFYENEEQRKIAETSRDEANASGKFADPIVTEITAASTFYVAEDYHQEYYDLNKSYPYCRAVITPKLKKLGLE
ncbi:peptide-methionine (S)-S-oxide reductase MsrA [Pelagicoccus mobilis]|uniref:Peptide methionine sulfoxide reductase MsrA n=1 Tax=Pelagicoccus mobilis TaxID=415221 RepID=A0A934RV43_9BACT|nr:peptide-methionine (S)-S-oxide reductase MsrA [Pelagicoccus mobilis]MBK1875386.1 peptide-methionine (S)-S-oxide reductase MsrA [Pelagicoccus mobilis]